MQPTLSVIVPNYNHGHYVEEALEAIVNQSFRPLEVIVIDDASTDNSVKVLEEYAKRDPVICLIKNAKNMGAVPNVSKHLHLIRGEYVCMAAADDKILPGFFEKSMNLLARYPQAGLCSTYTQCIDAAGRDKGILHLPAVSHSAGFLPPDKALSMLDKQGLWIQGNTVILRRQALMDSGGLIPELHSFCDGFIYMVIAAKYGVCFLPEPLTAWRQLDSSYSANVAKDPERVIQIIHHAKELMSTTYRDLFSAEFVDRWERRALLDYRLSRYLVAQNAAGDGSRRAASSRNPLRKCWLGLRRSFTKTKYAMLKSYLYYRADLPVKPLYTQRLRRICRVLSK